jgi:hypothetical protein
MENGSDGIMVSEMVLAQKEFIIQNQTLTT